MPLEWGGDGGGTCMCSLPLCCLRARAAVVIISAVVLFSVPVASLFAPSLSLFLPPAQPPPPPPSLGLLQPLSPPRAPLPPAPAANIARMEKYVCNWTGGGEIR